MTDPVEIEISNQIGKILDIEPSKILECLEKPKNKDLADIALPVPKLNKFKPIGKPDQAVANLLSKIVLNDLIKEVTTTGPYLNFKVNHTVQIKHVLAKIIKDGANYGITNVGQGKKIVVEFSSPNIAKPFHAGHLRSTIIGKFMVNIFKAMGYETVSINYLGDWGKQYGLLAVGFEKFGDEQLLALDPIKHLFEVYVKINELIEKDPTINDQARAYFKKMEDGDVSALALWQRFRDLSIEKYKQIYSRLNISFDVYSGESLVSGDSMEAEYNKLIEKGLIQDSQGAKIIDLSKQGCGKVLVKKTDGASLYITRDISAAKSRKDLYNFDKMYYVVASQQDLHFRQLFNIFKSMGYDWCKDLTHINYGMVLGMSTRKGTVVFLEDILNKTKSKMLKSMQAVPEKFAEIQNPDEVANIVSLSAIVVQDFSARRIKDYEFDWKRMLKSDGDTGVYLQYAYARLASIERKSGAVFNPEADLSLLVEPVAYELAMTLARFNETLLLTLNQLEATVLVTYLFDVAHCVSAAYTPLKIKDLPDKNTAEARYVLFWAARIVLQSGLKILGLTPLERM